MCIYTHTDVNISAYIHGSFRYMWGEAPTCLEDVYDVFDRFVRGRVPRLPWCDRIESETTEGGLLKPLSAINHYGYLTINRYVCLHLCELIISH
jgi:hypothetical protein